MKINWGIVITIFLGIVAIVLSIILIRRADKNKENGNGNGIIPGNGSPAPGGNGGAPVPAPNPAIGKIAYASIAGVKVFNSNYSIYKTAAKDEWVGTVQGTKDGLFYVVSAGRLVGMGSVYLK